MISFTCPVLTGRELATPRAHQRCASRQALPCLQTFLETSVLCVKYFHPNIMNHFLILRLRLNCIFGICHPAINSYIATSIWVPPLTLVKAQVDLVFNFCLPMLFASQAFCSLDCPSQRCRDPPCLSRGNPRRKLHSRARSAPEKTSGISRIRYVLCETCLNASSV